MNLSLLCDFYEFNMAYAYFKQGMHKQIAYFEVFFRKAPDNASFALFSGLEQIIHFIQNFSFLDDDIAYLKTKYNFDDDFLLYLSNIKFSGDVFSIEEGRCVFANEPLMIIKAPIIEALLLETFILLTINHQSLISTKTNRIIRSAKEKIVLEFGSRRAHGVDAALNGARAAFIGGARASACTLAGKVFDIPLKGTMSHAWVQSFKDEEQAFRAYCKTHSDDITLLVDTYNCKQGINNAIKIFKEFKMQENMKNYSIRIDSGDLLKFSKLARIMLDTAGLKDCKIIASNSLDEYAIEKLIKNKAPIDAFGIGEKLITSSSSPIFGAVYKLVAMEENGHIMPKIKISEQDSKTTLPYFKKLVRYYKNEKNSFDMIYSYDENIKNFPNYKHEKLLKDIFCNGVLIYTTPSLNEIQKKCQEDIKRLDISLTKLNNPKSYKIKISSKLQKIKNAIL